MDLVKKSIEDILGLDTNTTDAVVSRLAEIGVCGLSDLTDITVSDLTPNVSMTIPACKLVHCWANTTLEDQNSSYPVAVSTSHQALATMSISETSLSHQSPIFQTQVEDSRSVNFDVKACIAKMQAEKQPALHQTAHRLTEGRLLTPAECS